jgi:hypothetical protein
LAGHLGRTVGELERTMSAVELMEWHHLQSIEPIPDALWIGAKICATVINANRAKGGKAVTAEDVIPILKGPRTEQTDEQKARVLGQWLED